MLVAAFVVRPVDPVENVKETVSAHEKHVVARQVLDFTVALQNNQLRQNANALEVNGKGPQQFNKVKAARLFGRAANHVRNQGHNRTGSHAKLVMQKSVLTLVVRRLDGFLKANRVNDTRRAGNVHDLHERIVEAVVGSKEIQIARRKDNQVQFVRAHRNT